MYDIFISYNTQDQEIANRTYERLTQSGYRCFLSTRGIQSTDWAGDIMQALEHSRGFVVIVSKNAVLSNEVVKEVTLATRYSRFIFPLRTDDAQMDRAMEYHLAPFQWISAVLPPLELRLEELIRRIGTAFQGSEKSGNYNDSRLELLGQVISPRAEFTGRVRELAELHRRFSDGANCIFLCGMGGIGKSEVARAYARQHRQDYRTVVMATYEQDLMQLIADDQAISIRGFSRGGVNGGQVESTESYYARKLEVLRGLVGQDTLLIIDNFDVEEDPRLEEILSLNCRFLITTRTNFEEYGYETLFLAPMDPETELLPIMERLDRPYPQEADRAAALEIISLLDSHTYAVSLTASQMKAGHIKPGKMLQMLRSEGLRYQTRSTFSRSVKAQKDTAYGYIRMLFDFSGLDAESVKLLQCLYCAPLEGIDIDLFLECTGLEDFEPIHRLINLNWIQQDVEQDTIRLHMLMRELIEAEWKPTVWDVETYFTTLGAKVWNAWNAPYEENLIYKAPVLAMLQRFPELSKEHIYVWDGYSTFCWIMNAFEASEKAALKQYALACQGYGEYSTEASFMALRVAAVYHNQNDFARARPWYQKGKEIALAMGGDSFDAAQAIFKVARSDMQLGDLDLAEEGFSQALAMVDRIQENPLDELTVLRIGINRAFFAASQALIAGGKGDFSTAIPLAEQQAETIRHNYPDRRGTLHGFLNTLAVLYGACGDYTRAVEAITEANEISMEFHGENSIDTLQGLEIYGDILLQSGRPMEAAHQYEQALNRMEKFFPGNADGIALLTQKYQQSRNGETFPIPFRYLPL